MKVDILAIGVHPDDIELACSGTLLHQISLGYKVALLDLTRGELGTRGTAETRDEEAANAGRAMGALERSNTRFADGFFENDGTHRLAIMQYLRFYQPEIVLANAPSDRHPDHGRAAKLVAEACFYSGLPKIKTEYQGQAQAAWRPKQLFHYIQDRYLKPDFVVDISPYIEQKMHLIQLFKTQFYQENSASNEPETPISGQSFFEFVKARAREMGRPAGYEYAEGFLTSRITGVSNLFNLT
jgi:bacillithiol biosynthesis deacetylase BshB1